MKALVKKTPQKLSKGKLRVIRADMTSAYNAYENNLLRRALYKTSNRETSQDLVQETFLKTLLYLQRGGKVELMRSFLNHILGDLIIDEYRKNKPISFDVLLEKGFEPGLSYIDRDINIIDGKGVIMLIPQLPQKYELVIRLRYLKGLSLKETAKITGQSENTVAVQVHRGMEKLKKLYAEHTLV